MKPDSTSPALSVGLKRKLADAMLTCYQEAPSLFVAVAPDLYSEMKAEVGSGVRQRMFEGYVTEREESERSQRIQKILDQATVSRDDALQLLEDVAALGTIDQTLRLRLIARVEEPLRLELNRPRNDTVLCKREPAMKQAPLVAGVVLHTGFDGRLVKIQFLRDQMERRQSALSMCGSQARGDR